MLALVLDSLYSGPSQDLAMLAAEGRELLFADVIPLARLFRDGAGETFPVCADDTILRTALADILTKN